MDPILIDLNSLAVRCIMAAAPDELSNDLEFTGGIYGSVNTVRTILENREVQGGRIFACFDHSIPPRRLRLIPEYKKKSKKREEAGDYHPFDTAEQKSAAFQQIGALWDILPTLGVTCLCFKEREADDCIGAAAQILLERGQRPLVVSSDRDLWQTVGWGCRVWDLHNHELLDARNFTSRAKASTDTYLLYKALDGDSSDGIPGAHGWGEKYLGQLWEDAHWDIRLCREPLDQLAALCAYLGRKKARTRREVTLLRDRPRLERVIMGIDLRSSFGPTERLEGKLTGAAPRVQWMEFLRKLKQYGLRNVIGSHQSFVKPFQLAAKRGKSATA